MRPRLGPFELDHPLAAGGMGEVWLAHHVEQGIPAAVKVLLGAGDAPRLIESLRQEIRAIAALDHPNLVWIYADGLIDAEAAALHPRLTAGTPWLALEYVEGGTLLDVPRDWDAVRSRILEALDGLAHAHASGVVHRDIKPQNILLTRDGQARITDFGLAWAMGQSVLGENRGSSSAGTVAYMAPEQIFGDGGDQGPWTDLYAIGVALWQLVCGERPFPGRGQEQHMAKVRHDFKPFVPQFAVPKDLLEWLELALQPASAHRFRCAAEARVALGSLAPLAGRTAPRRAAPEPAEPTWDDDATVLRTPAEHGGGPKPGRLAARRLALPQTWRRREHTRTRFVTGAGLGLFGLRQLPVVGREAHCDLLWSQLQRVHTHRETCAVVLHGPSGCGKSHLASWLTRRAHEVGGANLVMARYHTHVSEHDGLRAMVFPALQCSSHEEEDLERGVARHLGQHGEESGPDEAELLGLLRGQGLTTASAVYEAIWRMLARMARERPVVLWLDDLELHEEGRAFYRHALEHYPSIPMLIVATVSDAGSAWFQGLAPHERSTSLEVGPLPPEERTSFIQAIVGVELPLAMRVAARSEGNPAFAIALLDHWIRTDQLEPGLQGYRLRADADTDLPASLAGAWTTTIHRLFQAVPGAQQPLELAATLGMDVVRADWEQGCELLGSPVHAGLLEVLVDARIAVDCTTVDWSFQHAALREALLERARPRCAALNRVCAAVLEAKPPSAFRDERIAHHLLLAGEDQRALEVALAALERLLQTGEGAAAMRLLDTLGPALSTAARQGPADRRLAQLLVTRAQALSHVDRYEEAHLAALEARDLARAHGWPNELITALLRLVDNPKYTDSDAALEHIHEAERLLDRADPAQRSRVGVLAAVVLRRVGELDAARSWGEQAVRDAREHGGEAVYVCLADLMQTLVKLGDPTATETGLEAQRLAEAEGAIFPQCMVAYQLGMWGLGQHDHPLARASLTRAVTLTRSMGDSNQWMARAALGWVELLDGNQVEAEQIFRACLATPLRQGWLMSHVGMTVCRAGHDDFEPHMEYAERYVAKGWSDPLIATLLQEAGDASIRGKRRGRAIRCYQAARVLWDRLGNRDNTSDLDSMIARLTPM